MNGKSFAVFSGFGAAAALLALLITTSAERSAYTHPIYAEYESKLSAYAKLEVENRLVIRRRFEEALAGKRKVDDIPDAELREIASTLLNLVPNLKKMPLEQAADVLEKTVISPLYAVRKGRWQEKRLLYHINFDRDCVHRDYPLVVFNEPVRLALLLRGDGATSLTALSDKLHEKPVPPAGVTKMLPKPGWIAWLNWLIVSLAFAGGFCASGYGYRRGGKQCRDNPWSHPLRTAPNFALGWLAMVAVAPGFAAAHLLRFFFLDARPVVERLRDKFSRKTFADEYERFTSQLEGMRARASALGDPMMLRKIEEMLGKVRIAQNRSHLRQLQGSLEDIGNYLDSMDSLNKELGV